MPQRKSSKKIRFEYIIPDGVENYLITEKQLEECPLCYRELVFQAEKKEIDLGYYKSFCPCGVSIYWVPPSSSSKVFIVDVQ